MRKASAHCVAFFAAPLLFGAGSIASAHEFWLEPSTFSPATGARLDIRLCVGDGVEGWPLPRNEQRIERFETSGGLESNRCSGSMAPIRLVSRVCRRQAAISSRSKANTPLQTCRRSNSLPT